VTEHVFYVRSVLLSGDEQVERADDIGLQFDIAPPPELVAARLTAVLLGLEPHCTDVAELVFTRIA
jgi:hypothetical protein